MNELAKILNMEQRHILKMKPDCERILRHSKYSIESRTAYCYYLLKCEKSTIEILESLEQKTSHDYFVLGQAYYNIYKYNSALNQFKKIKPESDEYYNAQKFILRIYSTISNTPCIFGYLNETNLAPYINV